MQSLICEYKQALKELQQMKRGLEEIMQHCPDEQLKHDKTLINSMIEEVQFSIQWMKTGRNPNALRGVDRGGVYLLEPSLLEAVFANPETTADEKTLSEEERFLIEEALADLTEREKEVFVLIRAEKFTFEATAELLGITKTSVQTFLERAERKVAGQKAGNIFLVS